MEFPPTLLILVGLIIVLLGIGAGMLLGSLNEEEEPEGEDGNQTPPGARKGHYTTVARLWRERDGGKLVVEMDGKSFLGPDPLNDDQRKQLEQAARDLRGWLGMGVPAVEPVSAAASPMERLAAPVAASTTAAPARNMPATVAVTPEERAAPQEEPDPTGAGPRSIVMQIEDILQDMLEESPLRTHGIHLAEDPVRGVIVRIGPNSYEGIDAVPDMEIKAFMRSAVAEWEKSQ